MEAEESRIQDHLQLHTKFKATLVLHETLSQPSPPLKIDFSKSVLCAPLYYRIQILRALLKYELRKEQFILRWELLFFRKFYEITLRLWIVTTLSHKY